MRIKVYNISNKSIYLQKVIKRVQTIFKSKLHSLGEMKMSTLYDWSEDFESKNVIVDAQHKYLFQLINDFANQKEEDVSQDDILLFLDKLYNYCDFHFKAEEQLMKTINYPLLEHHQALHKELTQTVEKMHEQLKNKEIIVNYNTLINFCANWLSNHIAQEDLIFVNFSKHKKFSLDSDFLNRSCEIKTNTNQPLAMGKVKSLGENFVVIETIDGKDLPLNFNDLVKVSSISPANNETQTFVAAVFFTHAGVIKLFNPTIIPAENTQQNLHVAMDNICSTLNFKGNDIFAQITDLSAANLQVTTKALLSVNDVVQISFVLQNIDFIATYKVTHVTPQEQNQRHCDLQLEKMDEQLYKKLSLFVFNKQAHNL